MDDLISRLSELRCQYNCFDENERDAYHALSEAIKALSDVPDTNVGDTIDRQKAIDALDRIFDQCEEIDAHLPKGDPDRTGYKMYPDYMTVWKYLHQLPSADAVEVVRCKDCTNFTQGKDEWGSCFENPMKMWRETDFCSWGERRDDG